MNIGAQQYEKIVAAAYEDSAKVLAPEDAELIIAIAQLAVAADRVDDPDEQRLFGEIAARVYGHANLETSASTLTPVDDEEQRIEHLRSHAAQLAQKPAAAALAFSLAYALVISDMDLAPEEGVMLETLREALGLSEDRAQDLSAAVGMAVTPEE